MTDLANTRALDRGIDILVALHRGGPRGLAELSRQCDLPKSTARRLLATLVDRRMVRRSLSDGLYRLNVVLPLSASHLPNAGAARLIDIARPHMEQLTERVAWPSDLHQRSGDRSLLVESTRPLSPFQLHRGKLDLFLNIFAAAAGRAQLAAMSDAEVASIHARTCEDPRWGLSRHYPDLSALMERLAVVRAQGYSGRRRGYVGESVRDDRLQAIAVAILQQGRPAGAVTLIWTREYLTEARFAEKYYSDLKSVADAIGADLDAAEPV